MKEFEAAAEQTCCWLKHPFIIFGYVLEPCIVIWNSFLHYVQILAIESLKSRFISKQLVYLNFLFSEDLPVQIKKLVELLPHSALISAALAVQAVQAAAAAAAEQTCCLVEELVGTMYLLTDRVPNSELQQVQLLPSSSSSCCLLSLLSPTDPRKKEEKKKRSWRGNKQNH
jgi:hypothetical protein